MYECMCTYEWTHMHERNRKLVFSHYLRKMMKGVCTSMNHIINVSNIYASSPPHHQARIKTWYICTCILYISSLSRHKTGQEWNRSGFDLDTRAKWWIHTWITYTYGDNTHMHCIHACAHTLMYMHKDHVHWCAYPLVHMYMYQRCIHPSAIRPVTKENRCGVALDARTRWP